MINYSYISLWYKGPLTASSSSMKEPWDHAVPLSTYPPTQPKPRNWVHEENKGWQPPPAPPPHSASLEEQALTGFSQVCRKKVSCPLSSSHPKMWLALPWVTITLLIFKADHSFLFPFSCPWRVCSVSAQLCELLCPWVFYSPLSLVSGHPQKSDS